MSADAPFAAWDFSALYPDEAAVIAAARAARARAVELRTRLERESDRAAAFPVLLDEFAAVEADLDAALEYARMRQYADALADGVQELVAGVQAEVTAGHHELELVLDAWRAVDDSVAAAASAAIDPTARYRLHHARRLAAHRLPPQEEIVWAARTESARDRWTHLQELVESQLRVPFDAGDGRRDWGFGDLATLLRSSDAALRQAARDALAEGVGEIRDVVALAWDAAVADRLAEDRLRGHAHPAQATLIAEDLPEAAFAALLADVPRRADSYRRFLDAQREFLGLDAIRAADREASVDVRALTPREVAEIAVAGLRSLHPTLGADAEELVALGRIDGETRPGKQRYAITYATHLRPPCFIGFRYTGRLSNVTLLGHELGHAVAIARAAAAQPPLGRGWPGVIFELPSEMGELAAGDAFCVLRPELAREMLLPALQDTLWATFQTLAFCQVELDLYAARADGTPLTADLIEEAFRCRFRELYGDAVLYDELDARVDLGTWANYAVADRFYNFQYSVGVLAALALQPHRRADPERFGEDYVSMLGLGRSAAPAEQLARFGLELGAPTWAAGLTELEQRVDAACAVLRGSA